MQRPKEQDSLSLVQRFVTDLWKSPLIDQEALQKQPAYAGVFHRAALGRGVNETAFFALPTPESFLLARRDLALRYNLVGHDLRLDLSLTEQVDGRSLEIARYFPTNQFIDDNVAPYTLFFTPDGYIVGSVEMAQKLRVEALLGIDRLQALTFLNPEKPDDRVEIVLRSYLKQTGLLPPTFEQVKQALNATNGRLELL